MWIDAGTPSDGTGQQNVPGSGYVGATRGGTGYQAAVAHKLLATECPGIWVCGDTPGRGGVPGNVPRFVDGGGPRLVPYGRCSGTGFVNSQMCVGGDPGKANVAG